MVKQKTLKTIALTLCVFYSAVTFLEGGQLDQSFPKESSFSNLAPAVRMTPNGSQELKSKMIAESRNAKVDIKKLHWAFYDLFSEAPKQRDSAYWEILDLSRQDFSRVRDEIIKFAETEAEGYTKFRLTEVLREAAKRYGLGDGPTQSYFLRNYQFSRNYEIFRLSQMAFLMVADQNTLYGYLNEFWYQLGFNNRDLLLKYTAKRRDVRALLDTLEVFLEEDLESHINFLLEVILENFFLENKLDAGERLVSLVDDVFSIYFDAMSESQKSHFITRIRIALTKLLQLYYRVGPSYQKDLLRVLRGLDSQANSVLLEYALKDIERAFDGLRITSALSFIKDYYGDAIYLEVMGLLKMKDPDLIYERVFIKKTLPTRDKYFNEERKLKFIEEFFHFSGNQVLKEAIALLSAQNGYSPQAFLKSA